MGESVKTTRRRFLKRAAALGAGTAAVPYLIPRHVLAAPDRPGANDRIGLGGIGIGRQGSGVIRNAGSQGRVVGIADVNLPRAHKTAEAFGAEAYQDYRKLLERKDVDAIVTAPISKTSWAMAKYLKFPGHTELLAYKCKLRMGQVAMMFVAPQLKVVLATTHEALFELRHSFTIGCVFNPIDLADSALRQWFGVDSPRIAVAGVNPHAGEEGRFGDEERRVISPAVTMAKEAGIDVEGPFPADTVFLKALDGKYDCVVAMYHDQGLIPIKLLAWKDAVNVTLGLPIIRTSPDHGTAFDIAGKNRADASSMKAAINLAIDLVGKRT